MTTRTTRVLATAAALMASTTLAYGQNFATDGTFQGSLCVGVDCTFSESFGFDTIRLKENNLRIKFQDTSTSGSFPTNDWQLTANDSSNGGANKFSIDDIDGGRTPFTLIAGAPTNSLHVDAAGDVGLGVENAVVELHIRDGDSPTIRLEQDGSSGFQAQTWDLAGNETNFFVRDVSNGSLLPFKVFPSAPTNSLIIEGSTGDIGMGIQNPTRDLHVFSSSAGDPQEFQLENSAGGAVQARLVTTNTNNRRIVGLSDNTTGQSSIRLGNNELEFYGSDFNTVFATVNSSGINLPAGAAFSVDATDLNVPDYVFADDYNLMPLTEVKAFISENSHLPNIPSAAEVQANGLNMTDMQMALLRKVEELTLYTIELEERVDALSN